MTLDQLIATYHHARGLGGMVELYRGADLSEVTTHMLDVVFTPTTPVEVIYSTALTSLAVFNLTQWRRAFVAFRR